MDSSNVQKQLFDEWKYRHEAFFKLAFRYCWYALLGGILPSLAAIKPISDAVPGTSEFFGLARHFDGIGRWYWLFICVFLFAASSHLAYEYMNLKGVEKRSRELLGVFQPYVMSALDLVKMRWGIILLWMLVWPTLYRVVIYVTSQPQKTDESATVSNKKVTVTVDCKP